MLKKVSVLIPVLNEINFIRQLMQCISEQTYPSHLIEVILIDGGSSDGTVQFIENNITKYKFKTSILFNEKKYQSFALNIGLKESSGEIIMRLDAHSEYERDYIKKVVKYLEDKTIVNIGGAASAKGYDFMSCIISEALNSPVGIGGARFRYAREIIETDTVFPGAWRKEDLIKVNGWNEEWIINEDTELNMRLKKELKGKLIVDPNIKLSYFPRNTLKKLFKQYFCFGRWRIKTIHIYSDALRYSHLLAMSSIPIFLIICFFTLFSMLMSSLTGIYLLVSLVILYLSIVLGCSSYLGITKYKNNIFQILCLTLCIIVIHTSWSLGSLAGMFRYGVPVKAIFQKVALSKDL